MRKVGLVLHPGAKHCVPTRGISSETGGSDESITLERKWRMGCKPTSCRDVVFQRDREPCCHQRCDGGSCSGQVETNAICGRDSGARLDRRTNCQLSSPFQMCKGSMEIGGVGAAIRKWGHCCRKFFRACRGTFEKLGEPWRIWRLHFSISTKACAAAECWQSSSIDLS